MAKRSSEVSTRAHHDVALRTVGWLFGGIILIQIGGLFLPLHLSWGFNYWQLFPIEVAAVVLGLALIAVHPGLYINAAPGINRFISAVSRATGRRHTLLVSFAVSVLLFALFYLYRSRAHVYGDGLLLLEVAQTPIEYWPFNEYFRKPLSMLLYRFWLFYLPSVLEVSPANIIGAFNAAAGLVGFWALFRLSRLMASEVSHRLFLLLACLASGGLILFFGYIEYYTWAVSLSLWSLALSIGHVKGQNRLWPALLVAIVATGFHLFAAPMIAIVLIAWWINGRETRTVRYKFSFWKLNLLLAGLSLTVAVIFQLSDFGEPVLKVWSGARGDYWAFGLSHLFDMANEIILIAPLGLIGLVLVIIGSKKSESFEPAENLLISAGLFFFLFSFWINPELGAARDWDLLSFFGFPFSLWGAIVLLKRLPDKTKTSALLIPVLLVGLVTVVPNLYEKNDLKMAAERLSSVLWHDLHYQGEYRQAYNSYHWGGIMIKDVGEVDYSVRYLQRAAGVENAPARRFATLASAYQRQGFQDSAYIYFHRALAKDPGNERILDILVRYESRANRLDQVLALSKRAVAANPSSAHINHLVAFAYIRSEKLDSALAYSRRADECLGGDWQFVMQLGKIHGMMVQHDSAFYHLRRALELAGPEKYGKQDYFALFSSALFIGQYEQARQAMRNIERLQPNAIEDNRSLWKVLEEAIDSAAQTR